MRYRLLATSGLAACLALTAAACSSSPSSSAAAPAAAPPAASAPASAPSSSGATTAMDFGLACSAVPKTGAGGLTGMSTPC